MKVYRKFGNEIREYEYGVGGADFWGDFRAYFGTLLKYGIITVGALFLLGWIGNTFF